MRGRGAGQHNGARGRSVLHVYQVGPHNGAGNESEGEVRGNQVCSGTSVKLTVPHLAAAVPRLAAAVRRRAAAVPHLAAAASHLAVLLTTQPQVRCVLPSEL